MSNRNTADYINLLRSEAQNHYRTQKSIYNEEAKEKSAVNKLGDFLKTKVVGWIFHYIKSRFGGKQKFQEYQNSSGIFRTYTKESELEDKFKIVIASDWASDTDESDLIGARMKNENGDYTIHLGDVYYVGTPKEIEDNFYKSNASWPIGNNGTLALPGNHEFYSNGEGYFKHLLPKMFVESKTGRLKQEASFFCLENDYWRILGLDTAYHSVGIPIIEFLFKPSARLDDKVIKWLNEKVKIGDSNDKRGLVILTHHQYFSSFEKGYPKAAEQISELLGRECKIIWLWGHEHLFAVYGPYKNSSGITVYGRDIGNGGMPVELEEEGWKPDQERIKEFNLVFFDAREKIKYGNTRLGHNCYVNLEFDKEKLKIEYKDEETWVFRENWEIDITNGIIKGVSEINVDLKLTLCSNSFSDATL